MKSRKIISDLVEKVKVTRRNFIKGALAIGAANTVYGCSKEGIEILGGGGSLPGNPVEEVDLSNPQIYTSACPHNCGTGTRCVSKVHVVNGRIVRIGTDDDKLDYEGNPRTKIIDNKGARDCDILNDSRALSCAKGKSQKYKAHHPGRLKYPLKQTKARGDVTGFIRISSQEALKHIATKAKAIGEKYGPGAIYNTYATAIGYSGTYNNMGIVRDALTNIRGGSRNYFTGETHSDYSYHQYLQAYCLTGHPGIGYPYGGFGTTVKGLKGVAQTAVDYYPNSVNIQKTLTDILADDKSEEVGIFWNHNIGWQLPHVAGVVGNVVSFGTNATSTNNSLAWPYIRAMESLKAKGGKVIFIGPELTDTAVTCATEWVQLRNYTDSALIMAMFHEMIIQTFNADGSLKPKADRWLDIPYLDTMVYGFFDSPAYWLNKTDGTFNMTDPSGATHTKINAVPAGKSLSAYVMGTDDRLTKATYATTGDDATYTSKAFQSKQAQRNVKTCEYKATKGASSEYLYKKDFTTPKTPEWAEAICGTPAAKIKELAALYCGRDATGAVSAQNEKPIFTEWAGGVQKQNNGVVNIFSIASLLCVTKRFGRNGEGLFGLWGSTVRNRGTLPDPTTGTFLKAPAFGVVAGFVVPHAARTTIIPTLSIKDWFNGIKLAFKDQLDGKMTDITGRKIAINEYIPDWKATGDDADICLYDDPGTKANVVFDYNGSVDKYPTTGGDGTYNVVKDTGNVRVAGTRLIINPGGNIAVNQHMNANDNTAVLRALPLSDETGETFCLATFDPFLSPTARYSDYVFPATMSLEAGDWTAVGGETVYHPPIVKAPGETKDAWRYAYEALKIQEVLSGILPFPSDPSTDLVPPATDLAGLIKLFEQGGVYKSAEVDSLKVVDDAIKLPTSRFFGKTREEVFADQYLPRVNVVEDISTNINDRALGKDLRVNLDTYLADTTNIINNPFIIPEADGLVGKTSVKANTAENTGVLPADIIGGHAKTTIDSKVREARPGMTGRFQVYNERLVWDYENRNSKWHGYLPADKRGQSNKDTEGDPIVYSIPMYFSFEDSFNEAYGVFNGKAANNVIGKNGITLSTTHDRYRVHSTHAENPLLRELTHRTEGGKWLSGNDWKEYSIMPERHPEGGTAPIPSMLSTAVYNANKETASWHEIWISSEDSGSLGVVDGDLVLVKNPIGAVRCVARVSDRCMKGTANLHQGGWYDPNPIDGVDDGGCANTLMASKPSRIDNGNAQQSAYVYITKTTAPAKQTK